MAERQREVTLAALVKCVQDSTLFSGRCLCHEKGEFMRSIILILISLLVFCVFVNGQVTRKLEREKTESLNTDSRTALVIGNGKYADAPLKNPPNDAADMAAALRSLGFEVLFYIDLDQNGMKRAIREFGARLRTKGGVGLFYYAGHGVQSKGVNYLIPVGSKVETEEEVEYESVEAGLVLAQMESAKNGMNIVILDACRNNPFARSFRSSQKGLASIDAPSGTLLAYSTAPGSVAGDGAGRNGVYTQELLKQIKTPGLSLEDVFKQVRISVRGVTMEKQTPWEVSSLVGNFYFRPGETNSTNSTASKTKSTEIMPSAEEVLTKYFQVIGGEIAIHSLRSLNRTGEFEINVNGNKITGTVLEIWKAPNKNYTEARLSGGEVAQEGFDGTTGWLKGRLGFSQMSGQQLEIKRRTSTFGMLANVTEFKTLYPTITFKGRETLNDKETLVIEAKPAVGKPDLFYFSLETGLLVRLDYFSESSSQKGVMIPTQAYFDEYVEINGAMIPFVVRELKPGYSSFARFYAHAIRFNISVDDAKFQLPKDTGKTVADTSRELEQARSLISEAAEQGALKNYDEAISLCNRAIAVSPNYPNAYNQRGIIYGLKGQFDKALADYAMAIKLNPYNSLLYYNRGIAYYRKNDFDSAIESFNKAIELSPGLIPPYSSRCAAFLVKRKFDQALSDCSKAIELDAAKASLYLDRSVVYERMGRIDQATADRKKYKELGGK
jgi:tetratricopeptide (TPR) repeat protein